MFEYTCLARDQIHSSSEFLRRQVGHFWEFLEGLIFKTNKISRYPTETV